MSNPFESTGKYNVSVPINHSDSSWHTVNLPESSSL
jgi:hypothetical protein